MIRNSLNSDPTGIINDKYLTVQAAVKLTGYNHQYLRRLLRKGRLAGIRVGQVWLIRLESLEAYLKRVEDRSTNAAVRKASAAFTDVNTLRLHSYTPEP